jgi:hypothetical protein
MAKNEKPATAEEAVARWLADAAASRHSVSDETLTCPECQTVNPVLTGATHVWCLWCETRLR